MSKSMTGFGRSQQRHGNWDITVEIKSVNHRYFEFACRVPRSCTFLEDKLKSKVQSRVSRGKTDLFLTVNTISGEEETVKVNHSLAKEYLAALESLSRETGLPMEMGLFELSRLPDVLTVERKELDEKAMTAAVLAVTDEALDRFVAMREAEGERMQADILSRLVTIEELTQQMEKLSPVTVEAYRNRLYEKLQALLADRAIEDTRILTEAAIFADRVAVDEETVRLHSHLAQFRAILAETEPIGRKLDFLTQELNRESNTVGSKAQDATAAGIVIALKSELEKVREQIQNIE